MAYVLGYVGKQTTFISLAVGCWECKINVAQAGDEKLVQLWYSILETQPKLWLKFGMNYMSDVNVNYTIIFWRIGKRREEAWFWHVATLHAWYYTFEKSVKYGVQE